MSVPKLVVFDLDHTLWNLGIDNTDGHFAFKGINLIKDNHGHGTPVSFFPDVPKILADLSAAGIKISVASTAHKSKGTAALKELLIYGLGSRATAFSFFVHPQIYRGTGDKREHFEQLHHDTKIHYRDMLFFDDHKGNSNVADHGVTFVHVPHGGMTRDVFNNGVKKWRNNH